MRRSNRFTDDDPVFLKIRNQRARADLRLEVLCKGIGGALTTFDRYSEADLNTITELVNVDLAEASRVSNEAEKAYEPYYSRRRVARKHRVPKKKKPKTKVVVQ